MTRRRESSIPAGSDSSATRQHTPGPALDPADMPPLTRREVLLQQEITRLRALQSDLLAALEQAARRLDDAAELMPDNEDAKVTHEMAKEARAALRLAKGEPS